ncbi:MAG: hypothetical protein WKF36_01920 [Candidatus Nitrosocosmicus sp.]
MNSEEFEFIYKRITNAALKDNIDRFTNCSGGLAIFPHGICKDNKETTRKEQLNLLNQTLKVL